MYLQILQNEKLILTKVAWRKKKRKFLPVGPFHGAVIWIRIFWLENRFMRVNSRKPMHEYQYTVHLKPALTYFAYDKWMRRRMIKTAFSSFIILCALSYRLQHLYSTPFSACAWFLATCNTKEWMIVFTSFVYKNRKGKSTYKYIKNE